MTRYLSFGDWLEVTVEDNWLSPGVVFLTAKVGMSPSAIANRHHLMDDANYVYQLRGLAGCAPSDELRYVLEDLTRAASPFIRLATAQVEAVTLDDATRLHELTSSDHSTIALSATATIAFLNE